MKLHCIYELLGMVKTYEEILELIEIMDQVAHGFSNISLFQWLFRGRFFTRATWLIEALIYY